MAFRPQLKKLLKEYTIDEICEIEDVDPIDALEYLIDHGIVQLRNIIEPTDGETD